MKRWLSLLLALVLILSAVSMTVLAVNPFTDVPQSQWYYADIDHAYQNGLINGKTATLYKPDDFLTYAEAVKLAAAMNQRYTTGSVTLQNGTPWYQTYVDYCKTKGIIDVDYQWNQPATRAGYIEIFAHALPDSAMTEINDVPDGAIPDVPMSHPQAAPIYKLYRVGILQGNNLQRTCNPGANIKRSEVAAILTRMMDSSKRIQFSMNTDALRITQNPADVTCQAGEAVAFAVKAEGGKEPYAYKWQWKNSSTTWQTDTGSTSATLQKIFNDTQLNAGMEYCCVVTDAEGKSVTSTAAKVTPKTTELKIKTQPVGSSAEVNASVTLKVEAEGGKQPYQYSWYFYDAKELRNWTGISASNSALKGGKTDTLSFSVQESAAGHELQFYCKVTDADGKMVSSDTAVIKVNKKLAELKIKTQPRSATATVGDIVEFYVDVEGGKAPYTYLWLLDDYDAGGSYSITNMSGINSTGNANAGWTAMHATIGSDFAYTGSNRYAFHCVVTDANGTKVYSDSVDIEVAASVFTVTGSVPSSVKRGETATLKVNVSGGTKPYKFTWMGYNADDYSQGFTTSVIYWDGVTPSADGSTLTIDTRECEAKQFKCDVTDGNGNTQRVEFEFTVYPY